VITFSIKQGASFMLTGRFSTANGQRIALSGCQFLCDLRDSLGVLLASLTCRQPANVPWALNLTFDGDTGKWPVGRYFADISISDAAGTVVLTDTFAVLVSGSQTGAQA